MLTAEEQALWDELPAVEPSGEQTPEHARNLRVDAFNYLCTFEGLPVLSEEAILAALDGR